MKTRMILTSHDINLNYYDAYNNLKKSIWVANNTPTPVLIPLLRDSIKDDSGVEYFIYDGVGILEDLDIKIRYFVLDDEIIKEFDSFLSTKRTYAGLKPLFNQILKVLDMNSMKKDYILHPLIIELELALISKIKNRLRD